MWALRVIRPSYFVTIKSLAKYKFPWRAGKAMNVYYHYPCLSRSPGDYERSQSLWQSKTVRVVVLTREAIVLESPVPSTRNTVVITWSSELWVDGYFCWGGLALSMARRELKYTVIILMQWIMWKEWELTFSHGEVRDNKPHSLR